MDSKSQINEMEMLVEMARVGTFSFDHNIDDDLPRLAREKSIRIQEKTMPQQLNRCKTAPTHSYYSYSDSIMDYYNEAIDSFSTNDFVGVIQNFENLLRSEEEKLVFCDGRNQAFPRIIASQIYIESLVWLGHQSIHKSRNFSQALQYYQKALHFCHDYLSTSESMLFRSILLEWKHISCVESRSVPRSPMHTMCHKLRICIFRHSSIRHTASSISESYQLRDFEIDRFKTLILTACEWIEDITNRNFTFNYEIVEFSDYPILLKVRDNQIYPNSRVHDLILVTYPDWEAWNPHLLQSFPDLQLHSDSIVVFWPGNPKIQYKSDIRGSISSLYGHRNNCKRGFLSFSCCDLSPFSLRGFLHQFLEMFEALFQIYPKCGYQSVRRHSFPGWTGNGFFSYFEYQLKRIFASPCDFPMNELNFSRRFSTIASCSQDFKFPMSLSSYLDSALFEEKSFIKLNESVNCGMEVVVCSFPDQNSTGNLLLIPDYTRESRSRCELILWRRLCLHYKWNLVIVFSQSCEFGEFSEFLVCLKNVSKDRNITSLPFHIISEGNGSCWISSFLHDPQFPLIITSILCINNSSAWKLFGAFSPTYPIGVIVSDTLLTSSSSLISGIIPNKLAPRIFLEFSGNIISIPTILHSFCAAWLVAMHSKDFTPFGVYSSPNRRRFCTNLETLPSEMLDWSPNVSVAHLVHLIRNFDPNGVIRLEVRASQNDDHHIFCTKISFISQQRILTSCVMKNRRNSWCGESEPGNLQFSGTSVHLDLPKVFCIVLMTSQSDTPLSCWSVHRSSLELFILPLEVDMKLASGGHHTIFAALYANSYVEGIEEVKGWYLIDSDSVSMLIYSRPLMYSNAIDLWIG